MVVGLGGGGNSIEIQIEASGAQSAAGEIAAVESSLMSMRKAAGVAGLAMAGLAAGGFAASINAAADFDSALQESVAIMGDVSDAMRGQMSDAAREVAKTTTFSASEAAEAYYFLSSAGLDAAESIETLPKVAQFAQAGMFDMATATELLGDAASALGLELEEWTGLSDQLVKANTLANASVEQFAAALTAGAASSMRNVNMETEEGIAILAAWADQGIKGEKAGTLFRSMLNQMQQAAIQNKDAFEQYGVAVFDAEGNMRNMADIVSDLEGAFYGMSDAEKSAALQQMGFTLEAQQGILALMGQSDALREYQTELGAAGGMTETVAQKQLQTFNAQMSLLKSQVVDVGISIGQVLLPHLTAMVQRVSGAIEWFAKFNEQTSGIAGVVGLAATGIFGLTTAFVALSPQIMQVVSVVRTALIPAMMGIGAPVMAVMAVIGLLAAAWVTNFGDIQGKTQELLGILQSTFQPIIERVMEIARTAIEQFKQAWITYGPLIEEQINRIWSALGDLLLPILHTFQTVATTVLEAVGGLFDSHGGNIWDVLFNVVIFALDAYATYLETLKGIVQTVVDTVNGLWATHGEAVRDAFNTYVMPALDAGKQAIQTFEETATRLLDLVGLSFGNAALDAEAMKTDASASLSGLSGAAGTFQSDVTGSMDTAALAINDFGVATGLLEQTAGEDLTALEQKWLSMATQVDTAVRETFGSLTAWFDEMMTNLETIVVGPTLERINRLWETHGDETMAEIIETWEAVKPYIDAAVQAIFGYIEWFTTTAMALWNEYGDELLVVTTFLWDTIGGIIEGALDIILTGFRIFLNVVQGDWGEAWEEVRGLTERIFGGITDWITGWGGRFLEWLGGVLDDAIAAFIQWGADLIGNSVIPDIFNAIYDFVTGSLTALYEFIVGFVTDTYDAFFERWTALKTFVVDTTNALAETVEQRLGEWYTFMTTWLTNTYESFQTRWTNLKDEVARIADNLRINVSNTLTAWYNAMMTWLTNTYNSFKTRWTNLKDEVARIADNLRINVSNTLTNLYNFITRWLTDTYNAFKTRFTNAKDEVIRIIDNMRIRVTNIVTTLLNDLKSKATSWLPNFVKPFTQAKERVLTEFASLQRQLVGNSILPEMLNRMVRESDRWVKPFLGPFREAKAKAISEFNELKSKLTGMKARVATAARNARDTVTKRGRGVGNSVRSAVAGALKDTWYLDSGQLAASKVRSLIGRGVLRSDRGIGGRLNNVRGSLSAAMRAGLAPNRRRMEELMAKYTRQYKGNTDRALSKYINTHTPFEMASGGIVDGPVNAIVGEAGPEAVVPLSKGGLEKYGLGDGGGPTIEEVNIYADTEEGGAAAARGFTSELRSFGFNNS